MLHVSEPNPGVIFACRRAQNSLLHPILERWDIERDAAFSFGTACELGLPGIVVDYTKIKRLNLSCSGCQPGCHLAFHGVGNLEGGYFWNRFSGYPLYSGCFVRGWVIPRRERLASNRWRLFAFFGAAPGASYGEFVWCAKPEALVTGGDGKIKGFQPLTTTTNHRRNRMGQLDWEFEHRWYLVMARDDFPLMELKSVRRKIWLKYFVRDCNESFWALLSTGYAVQIKQLWGTNSTTVNQRDVCVGSQIVQTDLNLKS